MCLIRLAASRLPGKGRGRGLETRLGAKTRLGANWELKGDAVQKAAHIKIGAPARDHQWRGGASDNSVIAHDGADAVPAQSESEMLATAWKRIAERLRAELGEDLYSSWFARIEPVTLNDGQLAISVPTRFLRNWLCSHYGEKLLNCWAGELDGVNKLEIRVRARGTPVQPVAVEPSKASEPVMRAHKVLPGLLGDQPGGPSACENGGEAAGLPLGHTMTFETFVVGRSNALAHAAAIRIAEADAGAQVNFNPLYIHSGSGLGKTHLLNAISSKIHARQPRRRVMYLTAERFMYRFIAAVKSRDTLSFKDSFQGVDVLLIDDFQFLQGRATQEFCHTFSSLVDSRRQVIVAADLPPLQLDSIDDRMRSRLAGGLVVDIEAPGYELRRAILERRLADAQRRDPGCGVPAPVIEFIAQRIKGGGRELEGALNRVMAHRQFTTTELTTEIAGAALRDLLQTGDLRRVKIDDILRVIGRHYNVARADLLSARRARSIVRPRQVGMFLAKRLTTRSLPEIGRRFGGRDHSTVLHAIRKVQELMARDEQLAREVELLSRLLEA